MSIFAGLELCCETHQVPEKNYANLILADLPNQRAPTREFNELTNRQSHAGISAWLCTSGRRMGKKDTAGRPASSWPNAKRCDKKNLRQQRRDNVCVLLSTLISWVDRVGPNLRFASTCGPRICMSQEHTYRRCVICFGRVWRHAVMRTLIHSRASRVLPLPGSIIIAAAWRIDSWIEKPLARSDHSSLISVFLWPPRAVLAVAVEGCVMVFV